MHKLSPTAQRLLNALCRADGELSGYDIIRITGSPSGTVYPLLERLTNADLLVCRIETEEEWAASGSKTPRRKLYTMTNAGRELAKSLLPVSKDRGGRLMETEKVIRRIYRAEAVQITVYNIDEVAEWCGGNFEDSKWTIHVDMQVACVGNWVVKKSDGRIEVFTERDFESWFVPAKIKNGE